tara:strand:- start:4860 stop:5645 length:786 start_codon:yes stop_codon:yes gene_type:complete
LYIIGLIISVLIGIVLGLVGGGGSILTVPLVNVFFGTSMMLATTYSLFIVTAASGVGVVRNIKTGNIDFKQGLIFVFPSMLVAFFIRKSIMPNFPGNLMVGDLALSLDTAISILLILVILFVAIKSFTSKKTVSRDKTSLIIVLLFGVLTGALSGFIGAGGGFIIVPILLRMGLEMKKAVGTSMFIISIQSFVALLGDSSNQEVLDGINWPMLLTLTAMTIGGVLIGTYLQKRFTGKFLRLAFNILLILVAIGLSIKLFVN